MDELKILAWQARARRDLMESMRAAEAMLNDGCSGHVGGRFSPVVSAPEKEDEQAGLTPAEREIARDLFRAVFPDLVRTVHHGQLETATEKTVAALVAGLLILRGPAEPHLDANCSEALQSYRAIEQAFEEMRANQAPSEAPPAVRGQDSC